LHLTNNLPKYIAAISPYIQINTDTLIAQIAPLGQNVAKFTVSIFTLIFIQMVVNIGMNLGLMPITGITLPLMSLGGSSLISIWVGLGILTASLNERKRNLI